MKNTENIQATPQAEPHSDTAVGSNPWLAGVPVDVAAKWYCELNCFRWPEGFPLEKPTGYDAMTDRQKYDDRYCKQLWEAVNAYVPRKEQSRAWHMGGYCGHKKTTEEFETWWASREAQPANDPDQRPGELPNTL